MAEVVTHARFGLKSADLDRLKAAGADVRERVTSEERDSLELKDPGYGEEIVGTLTGEEGVIFHEMLCVEGDISELTKQITGKALLKAGQSVLDGKDSSQPSGNATGLDAVTAVADDEDADTLVRMMRKHSFLHSALWWTVGERLGTHRRIMEVRSRFRIVTVKPAMPTGGGQ